MDQHLILEFQTLEEAQDCLSAINSLAADFWIGQGYIVIEEEGVRQLVGKNAATGEDEVMNTRTVTWDNIAESPDGTFYFTSPVDQYPTWRDFMPEGVNLGEEVEMPEEWKEENA